MVPAVEGGGLTDEAPQGGRERHWQAKDGRSVAAASDDARRKAEDAACGVRVIVRESTQIYAENKMCHFFIFSMMLAVAMLCKNGLIAQVRYI